MSLDVLEFYQKKNSGVTTFTLMKLYKIFNEGFWNSLNDFYLASITL